MRSTDGIDGRTDRQPDRSIDPALHTMRAVPVIVIIIHLHQEQNKNNKHPFNGPFPGLPRWAGTRKVKPIWILLKLETVSGSGISWAICRSAPRSRQITMPAPHHSDFYRPDAFPATQPTASKHWRHKPASRNAYKINKLINIVYRQNRTTENTLSDKE